MESTVPLQAFADSAEAILLVDQDGRIQMCNEAAEHLLGCSRQQALDSVCWELMNLRTPEREQFCSGSCPIQTQIRDGAKPHRRRLLYRPPDGPERLLDVITIRMPSADRPRQPVLHLLAPADGRGAHSSSHGHGLERLSPREREVLQLLASGRSTSAVAKDLFISPVTVRNHVQRILAKLGAHSRLEAVLSYLVEN